MMLISSLIFYFFSSVWIWVYVVSFGNFEYDYCVLVDSGEDILSYTFYVIVF